MKFVVDNTILSWEKYKVFARLNNNTNNNKLKFVLNYDNDRGRLKINFSLVVFIF